MSSKSVNEFYLLDGAWLPVTATLTFFDAPVDVLLDMFVAVRGGFVQRATGHALKVRPVRGALPDLLHELEPLVSAGVRRYLIMPTASGGSAYFENNWRGTDPGSTMTMCAVRGIQCIAVHASPNSYNSKTNQGFHGIRKLVVAWQDTSAELGFAARAVGIRTTDSGRWEFDDNGERLPFEDVSLYSARRKQDRMSLQTLSVYANHLGLQPFDERFYAPTNTGYIVEHTDPPSPRSRQFSLAEATSGRPFDEIGEPAR